VKIHPKDEKETQYFNGINRLFSYLHQEPGQQVYYLLLCWDVSGGKRRRAAHQNRATLNKVSRQTIKKSAAAISRKTPQVCIIGIRLIVGGQKIDPCARSINQQNNSPNKVCSGF
jgi:hypothetical protein